MPFEQVDILNDQFQLQSYSTTDGVCISSFVLNKSQILVGRHNNQTAFWLKDGNDRNCESGLMKTPDIIVQNYTVISSQCKGRSSFYNFCFILKLLHILMISNLFHFQKYSIFKSHNTAWSFTPKIHLNTFFAKFKGLICSNYKLNNVFQTDDIVSK